MNALFNYNCRINKFELKFLGCIPVQISNRQASILLDNGNELGKNTLSTYDPILLFRDGSFFVTFATYEKLNIKLSNKTVNDLLLCSKHFQVHTINS